MNEVEKYVKRLFYKVCQIVVQSRQGEKFRTPSVAAPGNQTWFGMDIQVHNLYLCIISVINTISHQNRSIIKYISNCNSNLIGVFDWDRKKLTYFKNKVRKVSFPKYIREVPDYQIISFLPKLQSIHHQSTIDRMWKAFDYR